VGPNTAYAGGGKTRYSIREIFFSHAGVVMPSAEPTFAELLAQARGGDAEAVGQIARLYEPDLLIAARVHLGPALRPYLDSLDLVQSVHRSLLVGLRNDKFEVNDARGLLALALTMVRRKVARQWRRHRRQVRPVGEQPADVLATLCSRNTGPAVTAAVRDAVSRLWAELNADEREVLELRLQGYSTAEAAGRLGKTPEALRVRLHRLRKRLEAEHILTEWLD
jgi:RNA polymerase sigma factor (sigma-70 family)